MSGYTLQDVDDIDGREAITSEHTRAFRMEARAQLDQ